MTVFDRTMDGVTWVFRNDTHSPSTPANICD